MRFLVLVLSVCGGALAAEDAASIMARVAANQDRAVRERANYIYQERVTVATRRKDGKLARQEVADYLIAPTPSGTEKKLQKLEGRYLQKSKYIEFQGEPADKHGGLDGSLVESFRTDLLEDKSKDGTANDLFPLTAEEQKDYQFELSGEQVVDGRKAYRVRFRPKDRHDISWSGEALIDEEEYQPVSVYTKLSRRVPMAVRVLLGTDLPGLGFSVRYQRVEKDVWFPASFGAEFRLHVLFFLTRDVSISSSSSGFQRVQVDSTIQFAKDQ